MKNILNLLDLKLGFKSPVAYQERNKQNHMADLESEIEMFLN